MADKKNNGLLQRLLVTFRVEADEYVKAMSSGLLELEKLPKGPQQAEIVESIFRQAHSLKGAARAVQLSHIESICQALESVFAALKDQQLSLSTPLADMLHRTITTIETLATSDPEAARARQAEVSELIRQLERSLGRTGVSSATAEKPAEPSSIAREPARPTIPGPTTATVRVSTTKLDDVMRLTEEMLSPRLAATQRAAELQNVAQELGSWRRRSAEIQPLLHALDRSLLAQPNVPHELRRVLEYVGDEQIRVRALEDQLMQLSRSAERDRRTLIGMTDGLRHHIKEMQLLPCAALLDIFARMARELAREQDKIVDLTVHGSDIEVDRRLLEELKDPLVHLVRNCIDHGIEMPAERRKKNKSPHGAVSIAVSQKDSGKVVFTVTDDGAGADGEKLKALAVERGLLSAGEADSLSETEALELVFQSGLSTSPLITDVSGRGLGLAIVREKVEHLGGSISIESRAGAGTTFQVVLPVSLATFRGTLAGIGSQVFIVPSASVDRVARIPASAIHRVNNRETITVDGQVTAVVHLSDVLEIPRKNKRDDPEDGALVIILGRGLTRIALRVDAVIGDQEVLVKRLGPQLRRVRNITGASVLGNGQLVPVLNVSDLLATAARQPAPVRQVAASAASTPKKMSVLVAEDSITSRSLLKNILEAAGFDVTTAVDGIDAFTVLKTRAFDLVVSDVDMPRMNGFDLTAKLRADKQLGELPVVLVTTLESREDRERGIDVGANAYIVKSSFDQSNLLDVIRRLL